MPTGLQLPKKPQYWGGNSAIQSWYDRQWEETVRQAELDRDMRFYEGHGFYPEQQQSVHAAQDAAQAEYERMIADIEAAVGRLDEDELNKQIMGELQGRMSGANQPFDERTLNALVSEAASPIMGGAATGLSRLRESFGSRGLGRSGGLGSLEQQLLQDAIRQSSLAGANIRGQGRQANFDARAGATRDAASYFQNMSSQRNSLISQLANLRSQKSFDPSYFEGRGRDTGYTPPGEGFKYSPPPSLERRRVGSSVPRYRNTGTNSSTGLGRQFPNLFGG
jgi:hypothetical protein